MKKDNRCLDYQGVIKESEQQLWDLERHQSKALLRDRMRYLRLLKTGECTSQADAGRYIGLKQRASEKLWGKYRTEGVEGLLTYPFKGSKGKLSGQQEQQLRQELLKDQIQSQAQARDYVEKTFKVHYTTQGISYVFERLKVKKKTGRPVHAHKDAPVEQRFKKSLPRTEETLWGVHLPAR